MDRPTTAGPCAHVPLRSAQLPQTVPVAVPSEVDGDQQLRHHDGGGAAIVRVENQVRIGEDLCPARR